MRAEDPGVADDVLVGAALRAVEDVSIVIFDTGMRIRAIHGGAAAQHGHIPERVVGRTAADVLPAAAWATLGPLYTRALTGETVTVTLPAPDGRASFETIFQPVRREGAIIGGMATSRDVTARVAADRLRSGWQHAFDRTTTGAAVVDPHTHVMVQDATTQRAAVEELRRSERAATARELHGTGARDGTGRKSGEDVARQRQISFETTSRGITLTDPETGLITQANAAFARMHGGAPEDFVGRPFATVLAPECAADAAAVVTQVHRDGYARLDSEHVRLDGTRFPVDMEVVAARDADGRMLYRLGFHTDVTELRAREEAERRATARFETSFVHAPIGMSIVDPEGRFLRVNAALCTLFGRTEQELLACDFQQLTHPDDLGTDLELLAETLAGTRDRYDLDKRYLRPDGSVVDAHLSVSLVRDPDGRPLHFVSQIVDLSARAAAERELAEAKSRLQAILDHSPTAIYLRDLDHRWQVTNPETCRIIGLPEEELLGRSMADTHPPEIFDHLAGHDAQVLAAGEAITFNEVAPDARTGRTHYWWSAKFPVRDAGGTVIGLGGMSMDVTAREEAVRELAAARELFETAFEHAPVGKLISRLLPDGSTEVVKCNPAFAAMLGITQDEVVGRSGAVHVHPDDLAERERMLADLHAGRATSGELRFRHAAGHDVWTMAVPATVTDAAGQALFVLQTLDISDRKRLEEQLRDLADHDALTGLLSRRRFEEELAREVARARRGGQESCLLLLDLDGFKYVNDAFGHSAGDELLTRITDALGRVLRETDVVARLGGDEFAVLLPGTDLAGGRTTAAKLVTAVRAHGRVVRGGACAEVTVSVGVTTVAGVDAQDGEALLVEADIAMYQAKEGGKDGVAVYERSGGRREQLAQSSNWIGRLRDALRDGRFDLHAQPVVPLREGALEDHHELLLRLRGNRGRLVEPGEFLPHAERHGLVVDLDRWVLRQAVTRLHAAQQGGRDLSLAVNVSARTVEHLQIAADLAELLDRHPIRPGSLMIEITETAAITNVPRAIELGRQVRELGCRLALDDFGSGFASFSYLKHLVFDVLKIDGDFVDRLPTSATDQLVVRAITDVAKGLGAGLIAERVGDRATVEILRRLGVDHGQGHFLGRPVPLDAVLRTMPG